MSASRRELSPMQFGLLGLFVLTFVAAIAAAIFRLPYSLEIKVILLITLWIAFQFVVMNTSGQGPARQVRMAVMNAVGSLIQFIPLCADLFAAKKPVWYALVFGSLLFGVVIMQTTFVIWTVRTALQGDTNKA